MSAIVCQQWGMKNSSSSCWKANFDVLGIFGFFCELIWETLRTKMSSLEMRTLTITSRIQNCWKLGFRRYPPLLCCWDPLGHSWWTSFQCIRRKHQHWISWSSWFAQPGSALVSQPWALPLLSGFPRDTSQSRLIDLEAIFCSLMTWLSQKCSHQCLSLHWQNPEGNWKNIRWA